MIRTVLFLFLISIPSLFAVEFFVAPTGNDQNAGTREKPLQSPEGARDALRAWRKANPNRADEAATVWLAGGRYELKQTFALNESDSGKMDAPVIYRAQPGEKVRITGGRIVPPALIKPVSDPATLQRVGESVRPHLAQIDLREMGLTDFGTIGPRGFIRPYVEAPVEVIFNDAPLNLAIFPKDDDPPFVMENVVDGGSIPRKGDYSNRPAIFGYKNPSPIDRWAPSADIWMTEVRTPGWEDGTIQIKSIDKESRTITTAQPHVYGVRNGSFWRALNVLEEISFPGEYAMNYSTGQAWFYAPGGLSDAQVEVTLIKEPLIALEGASFVQFQDLILENGRGIGVYIERGESNRFQGCTIRNFGIVAVSIGKGVTADPNCAHEFTGEPASRTLGSLTTHLYKNTAYDRQAGKNHVIESCDLYNTGAGGVSLGGGNRVTLEAANNSVVNCNIINFNRWDRSYKGGVNVSGVGNHIAHNRILNGMGCGIHLNGNDHVIEFNEIGHCVQSASDMGAFYMGRNPSELGNVVRFNYFHDNGSRYIYSSLGIGTSVVYLDDASSGTQVRGNVFYENDNHPVFINGAVDYTFENNLFLNCKQDLKIGFWGSERWYDFVHKQEPYTTRLLSDVNVLEPPYSTRYPRFLEVYSSPRSTRRYGIFKNNLLVNTPPLAKFDDGRIDDLNNVVFTPGQTAEIYRSILTELNQSLPLASGDPKTAPASLPAIAQLTREMKPVPFDEMGLYADAWRKRVDQLLDKDAPLPPISAWRNPK